MLTRTAVTTTKAPLKRASHSETPDKPPSSLSTPFADHARGERQPPLLSISGFINRQPRHFADSFVPALDPDRVDPLRPGRKRTVLQNGTRTFQVFVARAH